MNGKLSPRCVVCYHKNTHLNSEASWPRIVPSQGVFTTSVKITGAWKLCQKIWIEQILSWFSERQREGKAAEMINSSFRRWRQASTLTRSADSGATLPGLKQAWAVDPLLSFSAYQFPHTKMEIKTHISYAWCGHKWVNVCKALGTLLITSVDFSVATVTEYKQNHTADDL